MPMENQNYIMREITPLSERDCFYIAAKQNLPTPSIVTQSMN